VTNNSIVSYTAIFGFVLKNARIAAGKKQSEVAQKTRIQASGWAKIEKGIVAINIIQLHHFSTFIQVSVADLWAQADQLVQECKAAGKTIVIEDRVPVDKAKAAKYLIGGMLAGALTAIILNEHKQ
jgi:transcriptional regulator with XRE-family HTH domain